MQIPILIMPNGQGLPLPAYMTEFASGMDVAASESCILHSGDIALVSTGFAMAIPSGFEAQIRPRSGLAIRHGITVVNAPGTIDADYRGEIKIGLINLGKKSVEINRGDRIAQMVIVPVCRISWKEALSLEDTDRGDGGFGHTGSGEMA